MGRLKAALGVSNDGKLAEKLGLSNSAYANLKKRESIPYEKVIHLANSHKVNLNWLFFGQDSVHQRESVSREASPVIPSRFEKVLALLPELSERQVAQLEGIAEEYVILNRLNSEIEAIKQQLQTSPKDK